MLQTVLTVGALSMLWLGCTSIIGALRAKYWPQLLLGFAWVMSGMTLWPVIFPLPSDENALKIRLVFGILAGMCMIVFLIHKRVHSTGASAESLPLNSRGTRERRR